MRFLLTLGVLTQVIASSAFAEQPVRHREDRHTTAHMNSARVSPDCRRVPHSDPTKSGLSLYDEALEPAAPDNRLLRLTSCHLDLADAPSRDGEAFEEFPYLLGSRNEAVERIERMRLRRPTSHDKYHFEDSGVVDKEIHLVGSKASGTVIDCGGKRIGAIRIYADTMRDGKVAPLSDWTAPTGVTIRNCTVIRSIDIGRVYTPDLKVWDEAKAVVDKASTQPGFLGSRGRVAPRGIILDHVTVEGGGIALINITNGSQDVRVQNSVFQGASNGLVFHIEGSKRVTFKNNDISAFVAGLESNLALQGKSTRPAPQNVRETMGIDGSSEVKVIGNVFHPAFRAARAIAVYRNSGEAPRLRPSDVSVRHGWAHDNQFIDNIFLNYSLEFENEGYSPIRFGWRGRDPKGALRETLMNLYYGVIRYAKTPDGREGIEALSPTLQDYVDRYWGELMSISDLKPNGKPWFGNSSDGFTDSSATNCEFIKDNVAVENRYIADPLSVVAPVAVNHTGLFDATNHPDTGACLRRTHFERNVVTTNASTIYTRGKASCFLKFAAPEHVIPHGATVRSLDIGGEFLYEQDFSSMRKSGGRRFCAGRQFTCHDGELREKPSACTAKEAQIVRFSCEGGSCDRTVSCPKGMKISTARAFCVASSSDRDMSRLTSLGWNRLLVERDSFTRQAGCYVGNVSSTRAPATLSEVKGRSRVQFGCRDTGTQPECRIQGELACAKD